MYDVVADLDEALKNISGLLDQVRGKLGDRFLRLELALPDVVFSRDNGS